jgi:hypothetical protein
LRPGSNKRPGDGSNDDDVVADVRKGIQETTHQIRLWTELCCGKRRASSSLLLESGDGEGRMS